MMVQWRPATKDDEEFLFELHRAAMGTMVEQIWGWDEAVQRSMFATSLAGGDVMVIERDGQPVGTITLRAEADHVFVGNIEVLPAYHCQGIGSQVLRMVMADAQAKNLPVRLEVLKINRAARRLYERLGFVHTGETDTHLHMATLEDFDDWFP
jgi:ribosomal protein S18 acetylase RimI-like enzyme